MNAAWPWIGHGHKRSSARGELHVGERKGSCDASRACDGDGDSGARSGGDHPRLGRRPCAGPGRRILVRRGVGRQCHRYVGKRAHGHDHRRDLDGRTRRRRAVVRRHQRLRGSRKPRHLLQLGLHARGLGAEADGCQEGRRRRRQLGRQRTDVVGRPRRGPPPAHPRHQPLRLPRLRGEPDRRRVAAPRRHVRRRHGPLLHRRRRDRIPWGLGQRRQLERLAHRRLRREPWWLLRRCHRQRPHLRPRTHGRRGRNRHEPAGSASRHGATVAARNADGVRRRRRGGAELGSGHGQRRSGALQRSSRRPVPVSHPERPTAWRR